MNIGRLMRLRECQDLILQALEKRRRTKEPTGGLTFSDLFVVCGMKEGRTECGSKPDRFLDKAIQGLRRHGDIVYNRRTTEWQRVAREEADG